MGVIGIEKRVNKEDFIKKLQEWGFKVLKIYEIELKTKQGWVSFWVADVLEPTENYAIYLSKTFSAIALEGGEHTILGEVSAKLWNEAVKVIFPDGSSQTIITIIHDNFLNAKIPTENIKGIEGEVLFDGLRIKIPIKLTDLLLLIKLSKKALQKIDRLVQAYGKNKILSKEVIEYLERLSKVKEEVKESVDYETGFIIIAKGTKITTIPIPNYIVDLVKNEKLEKAIKIYKDAPDKIKQEIQKAVSEEIEICKAIGKEKEAQLLSKFLEKIKQNANNAS